jgi:hypothetical protein
MLRSLRRFRLSILIPLVSRLAQWLPEGRPWAAMRLPIGFDDLLQNTTIFVLRS